MITLTTDFGNMDAYAGVMKGVIFGINPDAQIVDVSHEIPPQDILSGAFVLAAIADSFPSDTIHLAVVDPGVGTGRRGLAVETPQGIFVLPDNGLLTFVLDVRQVLSPKVLGKNFGEPVEVPVPSSWKAWSLTNSDYWRTPLSSTFHGRDVFSPVAAYLSLGMDMQLFGERVGHLTTLNIPLPYSDGNDLIGHVIHIDRFGNLITTLTASLVASDANIEIGGVEITGINSTYGNQSQIRAIVGSQGCLEIAFPGGSAARRLDRGVGDLVRVSRRTDK